MMYKLYLEMDFQLRMRMITYIALNTLGGEMSQNIMKKIHPLAMGAWAHIIVKTKSKVLS